MRGLYAKIIFPRLLELGVGGKTFAKERTRTLKSVHGEVLEVGFGTGLNLPHYPPGVTHLVALDPEEMLPAKVSRRVAAASFPVESVRQVGEHLPFADGQFDCVVTTLTLCTIVDPVSALSEIWRVLRIGGTYVFLEHGRSTDPKLARIQDWLNPLWLQSGIGCGCNINRPIDLLLAKASFRIRTLDRYVLGRPRIMMEMYRGLAKPVRRDPSRSYTARKDDPQSVADAF
jgi:ubiquinone/menaquinone biosynthesis C-methylase UbiE